MNTSNSVVPLFKSQHNCGQCNRSGNCFGRYLNGDQSSVLDSIEVQSRILHRGDRLFQSGTDFEAIYVIKSGNLKTTILSEDGEEQIIGFYGSGDVLGMDAIATDSHACNAIVLDTCSVCSIRLDHGFKDLFKSPEFSLNLVKLMSEALLRDEQLLLSLGKKDAQQRLASFLLEQSRNQQRRGFSAKVFNLSMSRSDIGNHLNLAVETVSRLLTRFKNRGIIRVDRNEVEVLSYEELRALSGEADQNNEAPIQAQVH